jgi:hypothetical protein
VPTKVLEKSRATPLLTLTACVAYRKGENLPTYYIKAQRLSWFSHIHRMLEARATKKIFKRNPLTTRPTG